MTSILISLDEVDHVKRLNGIRSIVELSEKTGLSRNTISTALTSRKPTDAVIQALHRLGARPDRILVSADAVDAHTAA